MAYSIQAEAARVLEEHLLNHTALNIPASFKEAAKKVEFIGDSAPFIPSPGTPPSRTRSSQRNSPRAIYGRWFHLHGSMNASPSMRMVGVPEQDVTHEEAQKIYTDKVAQWDSEELDRVASGVYKQAGSKLVITWLPFPNSDYQMGLVGATAVFHALLLRAQSDTTFDIDVSPTQYNIRYYRLGEHTLEIQEALRAQHKDLHLRHYDEMNSLATKTFAAVKKARPDLFQRAEYFDSMSGKEWGLDDEISILTTPFKLDKSVLRYDVPSGRTGRSEAKWVGA
ncbi:hypothetical protein BDW75DRAFT_245555 [Aspergillus navahoensis]